MKTMTIREFSHNLAANLKLVQAGEHLVLLNRKIPIADIVPHNENVTYSLWKRPIKRIKLTKKSLTDSLLESRQEERR